MSVTKKQYVILFTIISFVFFCFLINVIFFKDWTVNDNPRTVNQKQESEIARVISLGISKEDFIFKVGKPDKIIISTDKAYEKLIYETTLPYSSYLIAVVELKTQKVIIISHGEDWEKDRILDGYRVPVTGWEEPEYS